MTHLCQTQIAPGLATGKNGWNVTLDIAAVIWPITILILLLLYRRTVIAFVKGLSHRVSKFEFAGISLELAKAEQFTPQWAQTPTALDLRNKAAAVEVNDSTAASFLAQLNNKSEGEYSVINLDEGEDWLTTRLYILSIVFSRMKGVRCFAFVETVRGIRGSFVGWAKPEKIRWALARKFPWLEQAYANAYAQFHQQQKGYIVTNSGKLGYDFNPDDPRPAIELLTEFLRQVQQAVPGNNPDEWILLDTAAATYERAHWINGKQIEDILGGDCVRSYVRSEIQFKSKEDQLKTFLAMAHEYVAVTNDNLRFEYLINRNQILEQIAKGISS
jgi:hypothetical protein